MPPRLAATATNVTGLILEWNQTISTFASAPILSAPSPYSHQSHNDKKDYYYSRITGPEEAAATLEFEQILLSFQEDRMLDVHFAMFCIALMIDIILHGLNGTTNSPWIAFLDSISHCSAWIASPPQEHQLPIGMKILGALLSKSASGLVTSTLFGFPAPFSQTFSVLSFMFAMVLCLYVPSLPQHVRSTTGPWRLLFVFMSALHKSRKLRFVMRDDRAGSVFMLGILTIELTGWVTIALRAYWSTQSLFGATYLLGVFIFTNRLRMIISLCAIFAAKWDSTLILPLLALHKSAIASKDGNYLTWW